MPLSTSATNYYPRRVAPPLPSPDSLPFPGDLIRLCSDCSLRAGCKAPVPGDGPTPARIMLVGEAPGANEDDWGKPFVGQAGRQLDSLLFQAGVPRESAYITNVVRCRPPGNTTPRPVSIAACAKWLDIELAVVRPEIVVAMGASAITRFLGQGCGTVEHLHGKPVRVSVDSRSVVVLPSYHPAAALHNTALLRQLHDDFQVLRGLAKGASPSEYFVKDEYLSPDYRVADTGAALKQMMAGVRGAGEVAVDTETVERGTKLWSVQVSTKLGTAWFVPIKQNAGHARVDTTEWGAHIIVHNYLYDVNWLDIPDGGFTDTMTVAYLCVAEDTPVLKADLSWYRAGDVRVGDVLVGFDEFPDKPERRHFRKSLVEHVFVREAECYRVVLSNGREVVCTGDHRWLVNRIGCKRLEWLSVRAVVKRMASPSVRMSCEAKGIAYPQYCIKSLVPSTWGTGSSFDAGWLSGIIDGEGSLTTPRTGGVGLSISQKAGAVLNKVEALLSGLDVRHTSRLYADHSKAVNDVWTVLVSGIASVMYLVGLVRPLRMRLDFWDGMAFPSNQRDTSRIVSICPEGVRKVVSIATSTGTYIANGLASHNCGLPQGLKELASRICGIDMVSYSEVVRPGQRKLSIEYLTEAARGEWPDPPSIEETRWDNKAGKVVTRSKKPWHISRKVSRILADSVDNVDVDPYRRWLDIPELERAEVEKALGPMPESSLADIPFEDAVRYANRDADATLRVKRGLDSLISELGLDYVLRMDQSILPMVHEMMQTGMAVDVPYLRALSAEYAARMGAKAEELAELVGHPFNPNSSHQVATVVYGELGYKPTAYTPTREISTDDQELKKVKHPATKGIIEYRRLSKLKGTYADALAEWAVPDADGVSRVHTTLKTTRVETGRTASSNPNLQNVPVRSKDGKLIRRAFVAPRGKVLAEGDLAQIEMCTQAHLARCRGLIDIFLRGGDPHTETAARIFGVPLEDAKQEKYRYPTKRANFGVIYMIGPRGLSDQIQEYIADLEMDGEKVDIEPWSEQDCERYIADWYRLYPEVKDYQMEAAAEARRYGYVRDLFGRIRYVPEVSSPIRSVQEAGLRQAANFSVTATAQGIIKLAMGELWRGLPRTGWRDSVRWLMQIHDSLIVEVDEDEEVWRPFLKWMGGVMTGVVKLLVPVKVDFKMGRNWGELEKVSRQ